LGYREEILAKALELSPMERAELIENLLSSFEFPSRKEMDALWAQEAENRIDAFERGNIEAIPAKNIFEEIEKQKNNEN
jgi:putative addiction module component (TIGR02574 family)